MGALLGLGIWQLINALTQSSNSASGGYALGQDLAKDNPSYSSMGSSSNSSNSGSLISRIWNDFTGKSNTAAQNATASALQEDAQVFNSAESALQREFEASEAQKNRDWQTEMSNTAYQRSVADLQAAGLNPWLAVSGSGASTPSAVSVSGDSASSGVASAQASNVNLLASLGTTAVGLAALIKVIKAAAK